MKTPLSKWTDNQKELLLKVVIISASIFCLVMVVFGVIEEIRKGKGLLNEDDIYHQLYVVSIILAFSSGGIMMLLMSTIELKGKRETTKIIPITPKNYLEFEKSLNDALLKEKYEEGKMVDNPFGCDIKYLIKRSWNIADIILLVNINGVLTEKIDEQCLEYCFQKILEDNKRIKRKLIRVVHIFCITENNDTFKKVIRRGEEQYYRRCKLTVVVSFQSGKAYIAPPRNEAWRNQYNILKKKTVKYLNNQVDRHKNKGFKKKK